MWLDNLRANCAFVKASLDHQKKATAEGVCRKEKRGVPDAIKQEEIPPHKKKKLNETTGALKAAATCLEDYLNKVAVIVNLCNKKLVRLMSSSTESINWTKKAKKV